MDEHHEAGTGRLLAFVQQAKPARLSGEPVLTLPIALLLRVAREYRDGALTALRCLSFVEQSRAAGVTVTISGDLQAREQECREAVAHADELIATLARAAAGG